MDIVRTFVDIGLLGWPIWATLGVLALIRATSYVARSIKLWRAGLNDIDDMTVDEFTDCVTYIFRDLGHAVESVKRQGDGALLIVTIDGVRTAVQAEHSTKANVPSKAVEAAVVAQGEFDCPDAMVVTNRQFTPKAREVASANRVLLCNRDELALMLREWQEVDAEQEEEPLDLAA